MQRNAPSPSRHSVCPDGQEEDASVPSAASRMSASRRPPSEPPASTPGTEGDEHALAAATAARPTMSHATGLMERTRGLPWCWHSTATRRHCIVIPSRQHGRSRSTRNPSSRWRTVSVYLCVQVRSRKTRASQCRPSRSASNSSLRGSASTSHGRCPGRDDCRFHWHQTAEHDSCCDSRRLRRRLSSFCRRSSRTSSGQ